MNRFADLPLEVQAAVCVDWLQLKAIAQLDSALCNRATRSDFLTILETHFIFSCFPKNYNLALVHRWMALRSIRCSVIQARTADPENDYDSDQEHIVEQERADDLQLYTDLLRLSGKFIQSLRLLFFDVAILEHIREHCTQLTSLHLDECILDHNLWPIISNNKKIHSLYLSNCRGDRSMFYGSGMSNALCGVNIVKLYISGSLLHDQAFVKIVSHTPNLRTLDVSAGQFSNNALISVSELCRNVCNLSLSSHTLDDTTFVRVITNLTCITALTVTHPTITNTSLLALSIIHGHNIVTMELNIGMYISVSDAATFLTACTQLRTLALHYLRPFNMATVMHTADLSHITSLNVGTDWDNGVLRAVALSCMQLQIFGCRFANQAHTIMTELRLIATQCIHLQRFYLGFTLGDVQFNELKSENSVLWRMDEDFPEFEMMALSI